MRDEAKNGTVRMRKLRDCSPRLAEIFGAMVAAVSIIGVTSAFAPSSISSQILRCPGAFRLGTAIRMRPSPWTFTGLRGYKSFLRNYQGCKLKNTNQDSEVEGDVDAQDENGFDPFFVLAEGMLHAEPTAIKSWPPPMPASVAEFEARLAKEALEAQYAFMPDPGLLEAACKRERAEWVASWEQAKPQETIARLGLKRDRWVPLEIPISVQGIGKMLQNPYVQLVLSDPQQRNYWIYATGRTIFFFGSSVLNAVLQIKVEAEWWRPWVFGTNYRRELSAALKRIAMSGESKDSGEFASGQHLPRLFAYLFKYLLSGPHAPLCLPFQVPLELPL
jgi:hypothetical protein